MLKYILFLGNILLTTLFLNAQVTVTSISRIESGGINIDELAGGHDAQVMMRGARAVEDDDCPTAIGGQSWYLEMALRSAIRDTLVDALPEEVEMDGDYLLRFYANRSRNRHLGTVCLRASRIKMVTNGSAPDTHYYSILLSDLPFYLLRRTSLLDIQRVRLRSIDG